MDGLTLRDYMKILFRQKWIIILCILFVNLTVAVGLLFLTPRYAACVTVLISAQKQSESQYYHDITGFQSNIQLALNESVIVTSRPVLDRALKAILSYKPLSGFLEYEKPFASPLKQAWIDFQVKQVNKHLDSIGLSVAQRQSRLYRMALEDLIQNIEVDPVKDTNIFTITVKDYDPVQSALIANIISRSYIIPR